MVLRKHVLKERSKNRQEAQTRIKQLDDLEDRRCLEEVEAKERSVDVTSSRKKTGS